MNNIFSESDYIQRNVTKDTGGKPEYSPMDPPDAYKPPGMQQVPYAELPAFLQLLMDEHKIILEELNAAESAFIEIRKTGMNKGLNKMLADFFQFLDERIVLHHLKEERVLFPLLHDRLLETGEHSPGPCPETAVDMLEHDHSTVMQLATLTFSLLKIASRLTDPASRAVLMDTAIEQGNALTELLRLHIFREENVVFPLAHKLLSAAEAENMTVLAKKYFFIPS